MRGRSIWALRLTIMSKILYLFPDTNAFVQCRPLEQVDWSAWKDFDEVHLIVSRPVQSEIDNQKNKRSGRPGRRARAASSLFREVICAETGPQGHSGVRSMREALYATRPYAKPRVGR